jgi:hypothetical protein
MTEDSELDTYTQEIAEKDGEREEEMKEDSALDNC